MAPVTQLPFGHMVGRYFWTRTEKALVSGGMPGPPKAALAVVAKAQTASTSVRKTITLRTMDSPLVHDLSKPIAGLVAKVQIP